jgi:hypothetical protein
MAFRKNTKAPVKFWETLRGWRRHVLGRHLNVTSRLILQTSSSWISKQSTHNTLWASILASFCFTFLSGLYDRYIGGFLFYEKDDIDAYFVPFAMSN